MREEVSRLRAEMEKLQRGHKRQAAPFSKGPPKENPKDPGRKAGDLYGMKAHREVPSQIDETYDVPLPDECPHCGGAVEPEGTQQQYQSEIPRKPIHRQFNVATGRCMRCGRKVQGRHEHQTSDAMGAAGSQLGPNAQAMMVHLNKDVGASYGKIERFCMMFFGIKITRGGAAHVILRAAGRCEAAYHQVRVVVRHSLRVYPDETGWKVGGRLWWLWVFVTEKATAYVIRDSRGFDVPEEILGTDYEGQMGHDGWKVYDRFVGAIHQQCLRRLLNRCTRLLETGKGAAHRFPQQVRALLQDSLRLRDRHEAGAVTRHGLSVATGRLESRLDRLLTWERTNPDNERFAKHLDNHRDEIFSFLHHPGLEATNYLGEQAIRPSTVNRKVWGGNRTESGSVAQSILLSVMRTCSQIGRDFTEFLTQALRAPKNRSVLLFPSSDGPLALPAPETG